MDFARGETYKQILNEIHEEGIENYICMFASYSEGVFSYKLELSNQTTHYFEFICDDILLPDMSCNELLQIYGIEYFEHSIYVYGGSERMKQSVYGKNEMNL